MHPLAAYAVVGFGAAAYSPAKYGILTELLPPQQLVVANGWIEGTTVGSIILGMLLGGALISPQVVDDAARLRHADDRHRRSTRRPRRRSRVIMVLLRHRRDVQLVHSRHRRRSPRAEQESVLPDPRVLALRRAAVARQARARSRSRRRRCSGARARRCSSSCIDWAASALGFNLSQASMLQGVVAVGIAVGAVLAAQVRLAAQRGERAAGRRRDGPHRDRDDLRASHAASRSC